MLSSLLSLKENNIKKKNKGIVSYRMAALILEIKVGKLVAQITMDLEWTGLFTEECTGLLFSIFFILYQPFSHRGDAFWAGGWQGPYGLPRGPVPTNISMSFSLGKC